jgi:hypothetical protein
MNPGPPPAAAQDGSTCDMRMDIVTGECRPAGKLTNQEIQLSLDSA